MVRPDMTVTYTSDCYDITLPQNLRHFCSHPHRYFWNSLHMDASVPFETDIHFSLHSFRLFLSLSLLSPLDCLINITAASINYVCLQNNQFFVFALYFLSAIPRTILFFLVRCPFLSQTHYILMNVALHTFMRALFM